MATISLRPASEGAVPVAVTCRTTAEGQRVRQGIRITAGHRRVARPQNAVLGTHAWLRCRQLDRDRDVGCAPGRRGLAVPGVVPHGPERLDFRRVGSLREQSQGEILPAYR